MFFDLLQFHKFKEKKERKKEEKKHTEKGLSNRGPLALHTQYANPSATVIKEMWVLKFNGM